MYRHNMNNNKKDKKRQVPSSPDASSIETSDTEDVSKLVSSGTSSSKSGGIDKDDIYSSDDSTRHLEKVQETEHNE